MVPVFVMVAVLGGVGVNVAVGAGDEQSVAARFSHSATTAAFC